MPRLPAAGEPLRQVYLSHVAVADNDPALFRAIVDAGLAEAHRRGFAVVLTGLATYAGAIAVMLLHPRENALPLSSLMLGGSLYVVFLAYVLWSVLA